MQKLAKTISLLGHPFLTIPLYTLIITFTVYDFNKAFFISFMIIAGFFIPVSIWNYLKTKSGNYTNFDVSVQKQRNSMYLFAIPFLVIVLIVFYFTKQSPALITNVMFSLILLLLSFGVNFFIKCSGHVSMTVFLAFIIIPINLIASAGLIICSGIIGWSRVVLKRHTLSEVITGFIIALITGLSMLYYQGFF